MGVLALWATPRTVSTAFERMMIERGDHVVLDEPWSRAYYLGPDRRSERFPLTFPESDHASVTAAVLRTGRAGAVFVKDMAYQALPGLGDAAIDAMRHTFLIREPHAALRSFHRGWDDFTEDEAGYEAQRLLFDRVRERLGVVPAVIDSDVLRTDPERVIRSWCAAVGIDHRPESLTWTPGMRPEWQLWREWYAGAARSTGFAPPADPPDHDELPARVVELADRARPHYDHMRRHALT